MSHGAWITPFLLAALAPALSTAVAQTDSSPFPRPAGTSFRVLSWNVSRSGFLEHRDDFRALVRVADPDLLILDEVDGEHTPDELRAALRGIRGAPDTVWFVTIGRGGGYQRGAVASREPLEEVAAFGWVAYPDSAADQVLALAPDSARGRLRRAFARGVAVHGAVVRAGGRRLVAVGFDLQCCGLADTWEERRRMVEARLIHAALHRALGEGRPDGAIVAGDGNLVATSFPLAILLGPYDPPHHGLLPAPAVHRDGRDVWTWDGRGTPFQSKPLDFQLYAPGSLEVLGALVLDSEALTAAERATHRIEAAASRRVSDHRPVAVDYRWR